MTPIILPLLSTGMTTEKGYSATGFSRWAMICGIALILFSATCVFNTKETNVVYNEKQKFSFKQIFKTVAHNDQLVVFMIFAMLSNAGWYLTSSTAVYYFTDVLGQPKGQSLFQTIGAVGSVVGLLVIPMLSEKFTMRSIYTISLSMTILGYALMFLFGPVLKIAIALDICYILASVGISSMFVSQTVFLCGHSRLRRVQKRFAKREYNLLYEGLFTKNGIHHSDCYSFRRSWYIRLQRAN